MSKDKKRPRNIGETGEEMRTREVGRRRSMEYHPFTPFLLGISSLDLSYSRVYTMTSAECNFIPSLDFVFLRECVKTVIVACGL